MARYAMLLFAFLLAACGKDEAKELTKARSWSATAVLVAERWTRGEVPSAYAREALNRAADELAQGALPEAAVPVADFGVAVAHEDRAAAKRLLEALK